MITKMIMPQLSLSMRTGIITKWYKAEGSFVKKGEALCEIEADKAVTELEAPATGYLLKIIAPEAEEFPVKEAIALIGEKEDALEPAHPSGNPPAEQADADLVEVSQEGSSLSKAGGNGPIKASPVAKRLAQEFGIDLSTINGTGPDGLINRNDVLAAKDAVEIKPSDQAVSGPEFVKLSGIKKTVAERIKASYLDAPHIELTLSVDMGPASNLRDRANLSLSTHVTFSDILIWTVARTLAKGHRLLNAGFREDSIYFHPEINIGLASESEKGLVVPVIRKADHLSLSEIAVERKALTDRVKAGKQSMEDVSDGSFTITNLGMYGIESFNPILTPGQSAILAVGKIQNTPVADDQGRIFVAPMTSMTLACDHRVVDGADGAKFLADLKILLEDRDVLSKCLSD